MWELSYTNRDCEIKTVGKYTSKESAERHSKMLLRSNEAIEVFIRHVPTIDEIARAE